MSQWNYRVIHDDTDPYDDGYFVAEVYYTEQEEIWAYSNPVAPFGTTADELKKDFQLMEAAWHKPHLSLLRLKEAIGESEDEKDQG